MEIFLENLPESIRQLIINYYNRKQEENRKTPLCFEAVDAGATIALKCNGDNLKTATFQTSTDGQNWSDYTFETIIALEKDKKVYFRAKTDNTAIYRDEINYLQFMTTQNEKKVNVSGNIISLFTPEFSGLKLDLSELRTENSGTYYLLYRLFCGCENIYLSNLDIPIQELHLLTDATVTCSIQARSNGSSFFFQNYILTK